MAATCLQTAIELKPDHVSSHIELGNVLQSLGRADEALECFLRAQALRPLTTFPAATAEPDFSILVLIAPGAGNTPYNYLIGKSCYESHFYALLPGVAPDVELLRAHGDIVVNLISDVDQGRDILARSAELVARLQKPVVNHPHNILATRREVIAERLSATPSRRSIPPPASTVSCRNIRATNTMSPNMSITARPTDISASIA